MVDKKELAEVSDRMMLRGLSFCSRLRDREWELERLRKRVMWLEIEVERAIPREPVEIEADRRGAEETEAEQSGAEGTREGEGEGEGEFDVEEIVKEVVDFVGERVEEGMVFLEDKIEMIRAILLRDDD